jgi:hypothetical protein
MCQSLSVKDKEIGHRAHALQRIEKYRAFTKGEQTWYVGKRSRPGGCSVVHRSQRFKVQDHDGSAGYIVSNTHVNPGHVAHHPQARLALHLGSQIAL